MGMDRQYVITAVTKNVIKIPIPETGLKPQLISGVLTNNAYHSGLSSIIPITRITYRHKNTHNEYIHNALI